MFRVLSITSSFFAASFIVLMFLGLLAWSSTAALADEPFSSADCGGPNACSNCAGQPCGSCDCDEFCCCNCDGNCNCSNTWVYNDPLSGCIEDESCF